MLCQICKKRNATFHLTEVVNSEKHEKHLCEQCAAQEGLTVKVQEPISKLVEKFVLAQGNAKEMAELTCSECGMTFMQFRKSGLLGCPNDYEAFKGPLVNLLEQAHEHHSQHVGKIPGGKENKHKRQHELMRSKQELQEAISVEDYERAAALRDQINSLEKQ